MGWLWSLVDGLSADELLEISRRDIRARTTIAIGMLWIVEDAGVLG